MKNFKTIFILSTLMFGWLIGVNNSSAATLAATLKGRILLQVEQNGEAWYVNPTNALRYYLGRPADAFNIMRELGLGISNSDFDSFNGYAPSRLSGRILLKVADSGKAYYINPSDLKMYYLGRPADAFNVMRELGLGITDKNLNLISITDIAGWKTYSNTQYGFSIQYPFNAQISDTDINGDRTMSFTSGGRNISFITSQGSAMVKVMTMAWNNGVLSTPPNCNDTAGGQDRTNTSINGINFLTFSMSKELSGAYGHTSATEYCAIRNGTAYKLITRVDYDPSSSNGLGLDKNAVLNQMVASFKILKPSINILSPNGGETFKIGDKVQIRWTSIDNYLNKVNISLTQKDGNTIVKEITDQIQMIPDKGIYYWTVDPTIPTGDYRIVIQTAERPQYTFDVSDSFFTITK